MKISVLKIETLLAEKSMTKADLANRCGISRQNVSTLIRRGTCEPRTAGKLASGLGVEVRDRITGRACHNFGRALLHCGESPEKPWEGR